MTGTIFQIQRFCTHDGPGIRTTVFLKGCSLRCAWCHNPEGVSPEPSVMFDRRRCIGCGACGAERDAAKCPTGALRSVGEAIGAEELFRRIRRDKPFFGAEGGVTFSGGEALLQSDFLREVMALCAKDGIRCAIDTAGNVDWEAFEKVLPLCGLFLYDVKAATDALHRRWTGSGNARILENLRRLSDAGARIWARVPVIGGVNDTEAEMRAIGAVLAALPCPPERVELLPYHDLGRAKCAQLGIPYEMDADIARVEDQRLTELRAALEAGARAEKEEQR
ncbi:MAG: glycyl-radical enzyme activating protein [Clostridia bacterium]|nr:glycyl-radical enzyme activating protein [Clostridia bacterium]